MEDNHYRVMAYNVQIMLAFVGISDKQMLNQQDITFKINLFQYLHY